MKADLETHDIEAIAQTVVESLKPYLLHKEDRQEEIIFDVAGLCKYLQVKPRWVYDRTHLKEIPHYKLVNAQVRFRKKDIDKWLESCKTASINDFRGNIKRIK